MTIIECLSEIKENLKDKIEDCDVCAELFLARILGFKRYEIYLNHDRNLSDKELSDLHEMVERRLRREPVQYILSSQPFRSIELHVSPDVFIPRPETEILTEEVVKLLERKNSNERINILEVGTGCGAISLAILNEVDPAPFCGVLDPSRKGMLRNLHHKQRSILERCGIKITACDISTPALNVARENATRLGLMKNISFIACDQLSPFRELMYFDIILYNPPYISEKEWSQIPPEVRDYEPRIALCGGYDGLDHYHRAIPASIPILKKGGSLALEVGNGMAGDVKEIFTGTRSFHDVTVIKDYSDIDRVVMGTKT